MWVYLEFCCKFILDEFSICCQCVFVFRWMWFCWYGWYKEVVTLVIAASVVFLNILLNCFNAWRCFMTHLLFIFAFDNWNEEFFSFLHNIIPWLHLLNATEFWYGCDTFAHAILLGVHEILVVTPVAIFYWINVPGISPLGPMVFRLAGVLVFSWKCWQNVMISWVCHSVLKKIVSIYNNKNVLYLSVTSFFLLRFVTIPLKIFHFHFQNSEAEYHSLIYFNSILEKSWTSKVCNRLHCNATLSFYY